MSTLSFMAFVHKLPRSGHLSMKAQAPMRIRQSEKMLWNYSLSFTPTNLGWSHKGGRVPKALWAGESDCKLCPRRSRFAAGSSDPRFCPLPLFPWPSSAERNGNTVHTEGLPIEGPPGAAQQGRLRAASFGSCPPALDSPSCTHPPPHCPRSSFFPCSIIEI